jgi:hypothetical protein
LMGGASSTLASKAESGREGGTIPSALRCCHLTVALVTCLDNNMSQDGPVVNRQSLTQLNALAFLNCIFKCRDRYVDNFLFNELLRNGARQKKKRLTIDCPLLLYILSFAIIMHITYHVETSRIRWSGHGALFESQCRWDNRSFGAPDTQTSVDAHS